MKIYLLHGMISSGKSSYCKNAAKNGNIIINDDDIVNLVHAGDYTLYNKDFKLIYKSIENTILSTALAMQRSVVIDRGLNVSTQGRQRWLALARSFDVACEAIIFQHDGAETHAQRRFKHDNRGHSYDYWLMVAQYHDKVYSVPTVEEGFTVIHKISYDEIIGGLTVF